MAYGGDAPNWDHYLQNSSALGILRPDAVLDVFGSSSSSSSQALADAGVRVVRVARIARPDGRSAFVADDLLAWYIGAEGIAQIVADHEAVGGGRTGRSGHASSSGSSAFVLSDTPPGMATPVRRTHALVYVVVLSGEIVLRLENGSGSGSGSGSNNGGVLLDDQTPKTVRAGDLVVVQPGAWLAWENHGIQACRMAWMMVGGSGQRIELPDGTVLG